MSARRLLGEAVLLFLVLFLPGYLAQPVEASAAQVDTARAMLQSVILGLPQVLLILHLLSIQPEVPLEHFGLYRLRLRDILRAAGAFVGALALAAPLVAAMALVPALRELGSTGYRWSLHSAWELPLALAFGLTAGYREELYFRAYLLGRFEQTGIPRVAGVAASTALFALGHLYEGVLGVALALVMGLYFSLVYLRSRSLHVPAWAHGLFNAALLALGLFAPGLPGAG
ncbi:MAG: CPBP family intramembrane metalloprotease [Spirochaetes bacterium]|nr:CPBP family intramembrane metalloprotease [Spirochaetota bacterium]